MSEYNGEVWDELSAMRRDIRQLKAQVVRLEQADLMAYLWRQRVHELGRCDKCGESHEVALVPVGPMAVGGAPEDQLRAVCESCFIRGLEQARNARTVASADRQAVTRAELAQMAEEDLFREAVRP